MLLDFNKEIQIKEAIIINQVIPGVFNFRDLEEMNYSDYEKVIREVKKIQEDRKRG